LVGVAVAVGGTGVLVAVGVLVGRAVDVEVLVGVALGSVVPVGVAVAVLVGVAVSTAVAVAVAVGVAVEDGAEVAVAVAVAVGCAAPVETLTWSISGEACAVPVSVTSYCRYRPLGLTIAPFAPTALHVDHVVPSADVRV
jgi:hypothetical protein